MNHYLHIFYHHISKKWCQSQKYVEMPLTSWASLYLDTLNFWDRNFRIFGGMSQRVLYVFAATAAAKLLQWCLTLCDPIDGSPPGSTIPGILQARTLEWVAISFSNAGKWSHSVVSDSSRPHGLQPTRLLCPWDFPGKSTGVGCHLVL